jgi:hypothetical protein
MQTVKYLTGGTAFQKRKKLLVLELPLPQLQALLQGNNKKHCLSYKS